MRKIHEIKIWEEFADAVLSGDKNFEIRYNDRAYQKGDLVRFIVCRDEFNGSRTVLTNHPLYGKYYDITYVLSGWGLKDGYVVFGIARHEE